MSDGSEESAERDTPRPRGAISRVVARASGWLQAPQAVVRLSLIRIGAPLFIVGFLSDRLAHADEWISSAGFRVPNYGGDYRTPLYVSGVSPDVAWAIAALVVGSAILTSVGCKTRWSALVFTASLVYVALADQLSSFTVTKIGPLIALVLAVGPSGSRLSVDAWWKRRSGGKRPKAARALGSLRFYQIFLPTFYCASGLAKARGDWLRVPLVTWTHLHDSYQTAVTLALASVLPTFLWTVMQGAVLAFEIFSPLWFALPRTRPFALVFALGMHFMIAVMFGPVVWFSLLMMTLLLGAYLPDRWLRPLEALAQRLERAKARPVTGR